MPQSSNEIEQALLQQLLETLNHAPATHAALDSRQVQGGDGRADAIIDVDVGGRPVRVAVECKTQAYPRDAREAIWQLKRFIQAYDNGAVHWVPLLAAEAISPGAREFLRNEGVGYFDSGGSLYLPAPGAFMFVDKPVAKSAKRKAGVIFRGRRAQVLHAVWEQQSDWFGVNQIAELAKVAPATASETLMSAERQGWLEVRGSGPSKERRLTDAHGLLETWTDHQRHGAKPKFKRYFVPAAGSEDLMTRLDHASGERHLLYEITGEAAAQRYTPYLSSISQVRCRLLDGQRSHDVLAALDARPVQEGWNLAVLEARSEGELLFRQRDSVGWLASPLKVYLDLQQGAGRSREIAQHLREARLQ